MSRYRGYGNARGARTYLSDREEFLLTDAQKNEAYERRKAADEAAKNAPRVIARGLATPIWQAPIDNMKEQAHGTPISAEPESVAQPRADVVAQRIPQTVDLFAALFEDDQVEEEEEAAGAPAP